MSVVGVGEGVGEVDVLRNGRRCRGWRLMAGLV